MPRRPFLSGYKTYAVSEEGFGNARQWRSEFNAAMSLEDAEFVLGSKTAEGVLGIVANAPWPVIQSAYRRAVMACHPDRCAIHGLPSAQATERFKTVTAAFVKLKARHKR